MPDIKKLLQSNRLFLEILGILVLGDFAVMVSLDYLAPNFSARHTDLLDAITLTLFVTPIVFWRSRVVQLHELKIISQAAKAASDAALQLEASLRETEALRNTVNTHAIVSVADHAGRIIEVNSAFIAISGYSREQLLGQDHRILNSGTHSQEFWRSMWEDISHGRPWRGEICNHNSQGQPYWVDSMIAPFLGPDGLVEKYVSMRVDITSRKVSEMELARQTELLAEVVEASTYGLAVYDEKQVLRLHNAQFSQMLCLPPELLSKKPFYFADQVRYLHARGDYGGELSLDAVLARFQGIIAARRDLNLERRQLDGRHIELHGYPISAGWTVLSYRDNTEREIQRSKLLDAQEHVRLATESAGIGIWSLNTVTGEQHWDAQQYRLFDLDGEVPSVSKIYDLWSEHLHPDDAETTSEAFQQSINNGVAFSQIFRIIRSDGAVRYIKALGSPRLGVNGEVEYIFGTNMDITDATLLAESMKRAREQAEKADLAKSQFLNNMSHEMRTPMNAVLGMLKLLAGSELNPLQCSFIDHAERAARMMVRMIDDILEHAQLSSGTVLLTPKPFRLEEILLPLSDLVSANLGSKEIDVLFDLDPHLPAYVQGDLLRLRRVLENLMVNAIKFTTAGEVVCRIALQDQDEERCRLAFCIRDTGIGIAPEFRERIFERFTQVHATTTRAFGGVGLGLSISQRLVELMGGSIVLESEPGVGSSFSFTLDLALADDSPKSDLVVANLPKPFTANMLQSALTRARGSMHSQAEIVRPERSQRLKDLRVLAVDDVALNQTVIQQLLTLEGALVTLAANGRQGVDAVLSAPQGQGFDVVLMDVQMPIMDGYEATRLIRKVPRLAQLPIIAVTANVLESDREQSIAAGMNHHLGKPYDLDELVSLICAVTGRLSGVPESAGTVPLARVAIVSEVEEVSQPMHIYWLRTTPEQVVPNAADLLKMGVVLNVLESVRELAPLLQGKAVKGLFVVDQGLASSPAMRALCMGGDGASMKAMPMIALADAATEEAMRACMEAGAVDMVPHQFAMNHLNVLGTRYLNERGEPRADMYQNIAAIDSQRAMENMQSDVAFFGSLLSTLLAEIPARKIQLRDDWFNNSPRVKHQSHALKGLALTLGLHQLAEVAQHTEARAAQGVGLDAGLLAQFEGELQSASFQILRWLQLNKDRLELTP